MNQDTLEGKWEQVKGLVKEKWGKLTDNDLLEIQGRGEQLKGKLRERYGYTKEEVEAEVQAFYKKCDTDCGCDKA